jgi:phosphotriesterase-related protein
VSGPVTVHTVTGETTSDRLGFTLTHEHLINSIAAGGLTPDPERPELFDAKVTPELAWALREFPYACRDNAQLDDVMDARAELTEYRRLGGHTLIEVTPPGQGRDRVALAALSRETGVTIIAGGGWYLERYHPEATADHDADALAELIVADYAAEDEPTSGVIGEVGVSPSFTEREQRSLRAACRAWHTLRRPLFIHLPGFVRYGHRVLDIVLGEEGVDPGAVVLCHMDPSGSDPNYQRAIAERGVWLEFDMIAMPFNYPYPGEGQSPSVDQTIAALRALVDAGHGGRLLFSHDLFLKGMLRRNGGNGLAYIPGAFLARLRAEGFEPATVAAVNTSNVRELFELAVG